ncbi:HNH endonuclease signature motif containing protein [Actinotalea fermentans]|nr:HNH endonuclease signature motif containing protein [Actinotalea fermentans]KGM16218.1 hypothetical protein N867_02165 [Actinotalea fermentans ATCC 43279 = JCM 9966 = DSM 3133]
MFQARGPVDGGSFGPVEPAAPEAYEVLARLDLVVASTAELTSGVAGCGTWGGGDRRRALARLDQVAGALARVRAALVTAEQRAQTAVGIGDRDFLAARARASRTGLGEARREVRQAETLTAMPSVAEAVGAGRVPLPHLDVLGRVAESAGERATVALARPETQERLVRMAERSSLREFAAAAARLVASFDPAGLEEASATQRRERFFVMSRQPEGTFLRGRLDHVSAEVVRTAIAAVGMAPDDGRTKPQADADALVALAERAVSGMAGVRARRTTPSGTLLPDAEQDAADARVSGVASRPAVSVLVPAETFAELQRVQRRRADRRADSDDMDDWRAVEPALLEDGTPVAMSELARVLCDSEVGRIVMSADGVPMDLGQTQRLYTGQQRRAVIVRDRSCAWNGCDVPAAYCEVHHIRWWDRDLGPTSVENGVLLCSHHHHVVHQHDLRIVRLGRPPTRGPVLGEPCRYLFRRRDGHEVNAPPGAVRVAPTQDERRPPGAAAVHSGAASTQSGPDERPLDALARAG